MSASYAILHIIIPFRATTQPERREQLHTLLECFQCWLPEAQVLVIEQGCERRFNRGSLLNIGVLIANCNDSDSVCLHDVDLLPHADLLPEYTRELSASSVRHLATKYTRYEGPDFLGGVLMMQCGVYKKVNGHANDFWGWGEEDNDMRERLRVHCLDVEQCTGGITDLEHKTWNQKKKHLKKTKQKCLHSGQLKYWHQEHRCHQGLKQTQYQILESFEYYDRCTHYTVNILAHPPGVMT